ncbi:hypothetical protein HXX76_009003 [Chlamydomonas incerta]|uniref:Protein kinase domain-containing protein n=1 Tax=Chlamydomonas incerta TaxID=51695 RepID=A0A835SUI0_CHLIN|nr:hypothetical protein HXX76_009003 [Chlamydomonas incerta]|eukprot:KAG2432076.1 hypothetical protein HXX76_009003 [Chlamydomonas incerta]
MVSASDRNAVAGQLIAFQTPDDYLYLTFRLACPFALRPGFSSDVPYSLGVYLWNNTDLLGNPQYADGLTLSSGVYTCLSVVVDLRRVCNPARSVYMSNTPSAQANFNCGCFPGSRPCPPADMSAAELLVAQPAFYTLPSPANCKPAAGTALNKYIANTADGSGMLQWDSTACGPVGTPKRSPSPSPGTPPTGVRNDQLPDAPPDMSPPPSLFSTPPPPPPSASPMPVPASSPPRGALPPPPRLQEESESPPPPPLPAPSLAQPAPPSSTSSLPPAAVVTPNTSQPSLGPTPLPMPTPTPATPTPSPSPSSAISNEDAGSAVGGNHTTASSNSSSLGPPQPAASSPPPAESSGGGGSSFFNGAGIGIIVGCGVITVAVLVCCGITAYVYCRRGARDVSSADGDSLGRHSTKSALGLGLGRHSSRSDRSLTNFSFAMVPHAYEYETGGGKEGSLRGGMVVLGGGPGDSSRHGGGRGSSGRDMEKGGSGGGRGGIYTYPLDGTAASGGSVTESHLSRLSGHDNLATRSRPLSSYGDDLSQQVSRELDGRLRLPIAQPVSSSALPGAGGVDPRGLLQAHAVAAAALRGNARQLAGRTGADGNAGAIELQPTGSSGNGSVGKASRSSKGRKYFLFGGGSSAGAGSKSTGTPASAAEVAANAALPVRRLSAHDAADRHRQRHDHDHGSEVGSDDAAGGGACGSSFSADTGTLLPRASGLSTSSLLSALSGASGRLGLLGGSRSPGGTGSRSPVLSGSHAHTAAAAATTVDLLPELPMPPLPPPLLQPATSMERSMGSVSLAHGGGSISMAGASSIAAPVTPSASAAAAVTEVEVSEPSLSGRSSIRSPPTTATLASAGSLGGHALLLPAQGSLGPSQHHAGGLLHSRASGAIGAAVASSAAAVVAATAAAPFSTSSRADSSAGASPLLSGRPSLAAPPLAMGGQLLAPAQSLGGTSGAILSSHTSGGLLGSRGSLRTSPSTGAGGVPTLAHSNSHNYPSISGVVQLAMTGTAGGSSSASSHAAVTAIGGNRYPSVFTDAPASPLPSKTFAASSAPATTFASPGTASPAAVVNAAAFVPSSRRQPPHLASIPSLGTLPEHLPESSFATHAPLNLDDDDDDATLSGTLLRGGAAGDGLGVLAPYGSAAASPSLSPSGGIEAHSSFATTATSTSVGSAVTLYSASLRRAGSSSHGGAVVAGTATSYGALPAASSMARAATTGGSASSSGPSSLTTTTSSAATSNASSAAARLPGRPSAATAGGSRSGPNSQGGAAGTPPTSINPAGSMVLPAEASPFAGATMLQQQLALAFLQQRASLSPPASPPPYAGSLASASSRSRGPAPAPMSAPAPAMRGGAAGGAVASSLSSASAAGGRRDSANFTFTNGGTGTGEKLLMSTGAGTALGLLRTAASAALLGTSADNTRASTTGSPLHPGRASAAAIPATSPLPSPTSASATAAATAAAGALSSSPQPGSPLVRSTAASAGRTEPASPPLLAHAASTPSPAPGGAASPAPSPASASPRSASPSPRPDLQPASGLPATPPASSLTSSRSGSPLPVPPHAQSATAPATGHQSPPLPLPRPPSTAALSPSSSSSLQQPVHAALQSPPLASAPSLASASSAALGSPSSSLLQLAPSLRTTHSVATNGSSGGASLRSAESLPTPGGSGAAVAAGMDLAAIRRYCAEGGDGGGGKELALGGGGGGEELASLYNAVCRLERGTLLCNKYKIRDSPLLGRHSVVLLAKNVYSRARVAIKFHATRQQYEREKAALQALSSTYVPALEEPLEGPALAALGLPPALVMEAGRCTLTEWLRGEGGAGPRQQRDLLAVKSALHQVLAALVHLHSRRLVHRDLKPANIMWFEGAHRFKLVDLAEAASAGEAAPPSCTPLYSPPEQLRAALEGHACAAAVSPAADMWAFGVVAFEVLSGSRFYGPSPSLQSVLEAVFGHRPLPCEGGEASALAGVELAQARRLIAHLVVRPPAQRWSAATCHRNALFGSGDDTDQRARAWDTLSTTQPKNGAVRGALGPGRQGQPPPPPPAIGDGQGGPHPAPADVGAGSVH